jgi:hypothetical protein
MQFLLILQILSSVLALPKGDKEQKGMGKQRGGNMGGGGGGNMAGNMGGGTDFAEYLVSAIRDYQRGGGGGGGGNRGYQNQNQGQGGNRGYQNQGQGGNAANNQGGNYQNQAGGNQGGGKRKKQ